MLQDGRRRSSPPSLSVLFDSEIGLYAWNWLEPHLLARYLSGVRAACLATKPEAALALLDQAREQRQHCLYDAVPLHGLPSP